MNRTQGVGRLGAVVAVVAVAFGASVVTGGPAGAAKPLVTAVGNPSCTGAGKIKINPPITNAPVAGNRTLTAKLKLGCTGATGHPSVALASGKWVSTTTIPGSVTCASYSVLSRPATTVADVKWKGLGGKIVPSHLVYSTSGGSSTGVHWPGTTLLFDLVPIPDSYPVVTGSYAGEPILVFNNAPSATFFAGNPACVKGIKKLAVSSTLFVFDDE
jgi:hypothetical protein